MNSFLLSIMRPQALIPVILLISSCAGKERDSYDQDIMQIEESKEANTYSWSNSSADKAAGNSSSGLTGTGTYSVTVTDVNGAAASEAPPPPPSGEAQVNATSAVKIPEKIIKTADITCRVEDYKKARTDIEGIVKKIGAYIASENEQNNSYSINNNMVIRVQNKDFDALVTNLVGVAKEVTNKNISTRDVTAQFVDIQTRLKTKKEIEKRYIDLLQKATKIQDILDIEEKIRVLREEIEAKEGELKYLADQVSYSTINLSFYQTYEFEPSERPGFWNRLASSMGAGWKGFLNFIIGFAGFWPLWLILGIVGYAVYKVIRRVVK
jgi:hypothetical protein